jgi:hypothetical protein
MLKWLAIIALACGTAVPLVGYSGEEKNSAPLAKQQSESSPPPSIAAAKNQTAAPNPQGTDTKTPHWYTSPEWWLCILGVPTLYYIGRQAKETRNAAQAALKQANHMIASERAWLVISSVAKSGSVIQPGFPPYYWWQVKNFGSTPARLVETQAHCRVGGGQLPEEPTFAKGAVELHERILGPGDTLDFFSFWENDDGTRFRDRVESLDSICLRAYGYIRYKTMFSPDICESRFCDYFNHFPDKSIATDRMLYAIVFRSDLTAPSRVHKAHLGTPQLRPESRPDSAISRRIPPHPATGQN